MIIEEVLKSIPKKTRVRILFEDESRFGRISDKRRCWSPLPKRPQVGQQIVRESIYTIAAVSPCDGGLSSLIMPWLDSEIMSIFLAHTAQMFSNEFCILFMDRAGWHVAESLKIPKNMKSLFLPPYSPELNPVEVLWSYIKVNFIGNKVFETLDELENVLCVGINYLINKPNIVKNMTNFKWINTLSMMYN